MKVDGTSFGVPDLLTRCRYEATFQADKWFRVQGLNRELWGYLLGYLVEPLEQAHTGARQGFLRMVGEPEGAFELEPHETGAVFVTLNRQLGEFEHPYWLLGPDQVRELDGLMRARIGNRDLINRLRWVEEMWGMEHYQMHKEYRDLARLEDNAQLAREALIMLIAKDKGRREVGKSRNGQARLEYARRQLLPTYCFSQFVKKKAYSLLWEQCYRWERDNSMMTPLGDDYYLVAHGRQRHGNNARGISHEGVAFSLVFLPEGVLLEQLKARTFSQVPEWKDVKDMVVRAGGKLFTPPQAK